MAPKTIGKAISDALADLVDEDLERFCFHLLDRKEKVVRKTMVKGQSRVQITQVLIRTYTEEGALKVVLETLRDAEFMQNAEDLDKATKSLTSATPESKARGASGAASSESDMAGDEHFIDKHRKDLIDRVNNVNQILDDLLQVGVIKQEIYDKIRAIPTTQEKMRELYSGPLKAGKASKDALYNSLKENEKYLMDSLENK